MNVRVKTRLLALAAVLPIGLVAATLAQPGAMSGMGKDEVILRPDQMQWRDGPDSLPAGARMVLLHGDPSREGPFAIRVEMPPNYRIPLHTHPKNEHVTVLRGMLILSMEGGSDEGERLGEGSFFMMPAGMRHEARAGDQKSVIQLHGIGPWDIIYINPDDDPRRDRNR
jgi:quercetin dioxygenase-like cupin family protein